MTWDYENQSTKTELPSAVVNTMTYNGEGKRVELQDSTGTSKFLWDGDNYLATMDASDITTAIFTNVPMQFGDLISQRRNGATNFYHFDAIGSTRELTNSIEAITDTYLFNAFGEELQATGTTVNPFRYIGKQRYHRDPDTGKDYVIERIYDPITGRWKSVDPIFIIVQEGSYIYVLSNPVNATDPSGLIEWDAKACNCVFRGDPNTQKLFNCAIRRGCLSPTQVAQSPCRKCSKSPNGQYLFGSAEIEFCYNNWNTGSPSHHENSPLSVAEALSVMREEIYHALSLCAKPGWLGTNLNTAAVLSTLRALVQFKNKSGVFTDEQATCAICLGDETFAKRCSRDGGNIGYGRLMINAGNSCKDPCENVSPEEEREIYKELINWYNRSVNTGCDSIDKGCGVAWNNPDR